MNSSLTYFWKTFDNESLYFSQQELDFSSFEQGQEKVSAKVTVPKKTPYS